MLLSRRMECPSKSSWGVRFMYGSCGYVTPATGAKKKSVIWPQLCGWTGPDPRGVEKFPFWDGDSNFNLLWHGRQVAKQVSVPDFSGSDVDVWGALRGLIGWRGSGSSSEGTSERRRLFFDDEAELRFVLGGEKND